jgi:YHS domain-containing protein
MPSTVENYGARALRGVRSQLARAALVALVCATLSAGGARAQDGVPKDHPVNQSIKGEFGNDCAMGLARKEQITTDCSINWKAGNGKTYCFSNEEAKTAFLKDPDGNLAKATEYYAELAAAPKTEQEFSEADATAAVKSIIDERSKDGVFVFHDPKLDADLRLVFDQIKIVRGMHGYGWFPNVIFHEDGEPAKQYAIDFWLQPGGDKLKLVDIRVQKAPKREGDGWTLITRMPVAWWWLPVSEHPGDMEIVRHWQVMSAINGEIASKRDKDGIYYVEDEQAHQSVPLQFIEIHQPIRRLKQDGRFFACTDFRKAGSKDEYFDVDFWLDDKDGKLKVREVKIHKVPVLEDGVWTQKPRYTFDGLETEDVK